MTSETKTGLPYTLRPACLALGSDDRKFWGSEWSRKWRRSRWSGVIPNHLFFDVERAKQDDLLRRGMQVTLAHVPGDESAYYAFVAYELRDSDLPLLHWVGVKDTWRKEGLATALLEATVGKSFLYSHRTEDAQYFRRPKWDCRFAPEVARRKNA